MCDYKFPESPAASLLKCAIQSRIPMEFLKPRTLKARQKTLALLLPCLTPVQDDLGNVPVSMQQDPRVNGALIGLTERICTHFQVTRPVHIQRVIATVFEEIYRREATTLSSRNVTKLLEDPQSELSRGTRQHRATAARNSRSKLGERPERLHPEKLRTP